MNLLREYIRELLTEAMRTSLPPGYVLDVSGDFGSVSLSIVSEDSTDPGELGTMEIGRTQHADGAIWEVDNVTASGGYGPLLYDVAMELTGPDYMGDDGLMPDRANISPSATGVWDYYFNNRGDVEKDPLPEEMIADFSAARPDYLKHYYYKFDTPVINALDNAGQIRSDDFSFFGGG